MTEQVTEDTQATPVSFPDPIAESTFHMINGYIDERNALVGKINAVKGDRLTLTEQMRESSTNPQAVEARARMEQAQEALSQAMLDLDAAIKPEIEAVLNDAEGASKQIEDQIKDLDGKIKPSLTFFKKVYGEDLAKGFKSLERLKGFSSKGSGSTGRRIRGYDATVVIDGESKTFDNLASVGKYLSVETATLQEAFFNAAGNPEALKDAPDRVQFDVNYTETYEDETTEVKTATIICNREVKDEAPAEADEAEAEATDED